MIVENGLFDTLPGNVIYLGNRQSVADCGFFQVHCQTIQFFMAVIKELVYIINLYGYVIMHLYS